MAIRLVGDARMPATDDASSSVASVTFTLPEGLLPDDLLVVTMAARAATLTITNTADGGGTWTSNTALQGSGLTYRSFVSKVPSGGMTGNPTFGWTGNNSYVGWLTAWRGVDTTTPQDATEVSATFTAAATATISANAITTVTNNAKLIAVFTSADNNTWGSMTAGWDQPYARTHWRDSSTTGTSMSIGYQDLATAGGNGAVSDTEATLGNDAGIKAILALRPASVSATANFVKIDDISTGTGTSVVTKTGYAGRPKLVLGIETRNTTKPAGIDGLKQGFCVMAEGKQRALYAGAVDNVGFGDSVMAMAKDAFAVAFNPINTAGGDVYSGASYVGQAALRATSDGFTFTPSDAFGENGIISTIALGGDDIVACDIADFVLPLGTGSVTYSNIFPFQPDFLIFANAWCNDTAWNQITNVVDSDECVGIGLGFCDASLGQAVCIGGANSQGSGATAGSSLTKTGSAYAEYDYTGEFNGALTTGGASTHNLRYEGAITAITSSGYTMNWTTVSGTTSAANLRSVIGIKLSATGKLRVINANSATSVTTVDITSDTSGGSLGSTTWAGAFLASGCGGTAGTLPGRTDETLSIGFSDGTNNRAAFWWYDEGGGSSGSVPTDNRSYLTDAYAYVQRSNSSASTAVGSATVSNLTGKVTLNFDDGDPSANTIVGFAFGPGTAAGVTSTLGVTTAVPTLAASASQVTTATLAQTTALPTLAAAGNQTHLSTLAVTTTLPVLSAAGSQTATSALAATTDAPALSAAVTVGAPVGTLAVTTTMPTLAAAGNQVHLSTLDATTAAPTLVAAGNTTIVATLAVTTPLATLAATQDVSSEIFYRARTHRHRPKNWRP